MIKSVIFDMDGTLLDSSYAMTCSVNFVRNSMGLEPIEKEYLEYHINQPDLNLPMHLYGTKQYSPAQQKLFREHYLENSTLHVKPYDGALELLKYLKSKGTYQSIATNAPDIFAKHMLKNCKLADFFAFIVGANNVEKSKPNPQMLNLICEKTSTIAEQTIFIGDSIKDEMAAKNANMKFIFADWGYGQSVSENKIKSVKKLQDYLENILIG